MEPQAHREGDSEWVFVRFYDFEADGLIRFNILTLRRQDGGDWKQHTIVSMLRPLSANELSAALTRAGFGDITLYGSLAGTPFDPATSGNLVATARRN
jgi:hypothetical protein